MKSGDKYYYVYILSNKPRGTIYVGSTNDLCSRIEVHKNKLLIRAFSNKYNLDKLVYYELAENMEVARHREWLIKRWKRQWKYNLIESINPNWDDLSNNL